MCELWRPHCSVFLCFFSGHVLLLSSVFLMDTTAEAVTAAVPPCKESPQKSGLALFCFVCWVPGLQMSLRSRGKDPCGVCEELSTCWLFPSAQRMLQVMQVGCTQPHPTACRSCPCWDGDTGWANICTREAMAQLSLQLQRGAFVQEQAGICWLEGSFSNAAVICYMPDCRHSWGSFPERE